MPCSDERHSTNRRRSKPRPLSDSLHQSQSGFTVLELLLAMCILGVLTSISTPLYHDLIDKAKVAKAIGDISALQVDIESAPQLPNSLAEIGRGNFKDPWGNNYVYVKFDPNGGLGGARKDRFLVPLNTTFDLYSKGKDGGSSPPLTAASSRDDIVRANDGGFVGLAKDF